MKTKYRKVIKGWKLGDNLALCSLLILFIFFIYETIKRSPYFVFIVIILFWFIEAGIVYRNKYRKIYYIKIKEGKK